MSEPGPVTDGSLLDSERFRDFYDRALPVVYGYFFRRVGGSAALAARQVLETGVRLDGEPVGFAASSFTQTSPWSGPTILDN